jgi:putative acetyltransferase
MRDILINTNEILDVSVCAIQTARVDLTIRKLEGAADVAAFRALNEEWIRRHFAIEAEDRRQLDDPVSAYIVPGGLILMAEFDARAIGCVALAPHGEGEFELSKMVISPDMRGRGAGRRLLLAAIDSARDLGATSVFLGSSRKLASAVHLYESVGFVHVAPTTVHMPYARADVFMRLFLHPAAADPADVQ